MSAERWQRLASLVRETTGFEIRIDERPYTESVYGRVRSGVSRSGWIKLENGAVTIHDQWWTKNPDIWIGYRVSLEDSEGIIVRDWPITKERTVVAQDVEEATR